MLKIGEFSKLANVTVKALHHYNRIDLFKPVHIDRFTGYRYYMLRQLPRLNRILALKEAGFTLEEVTRLLDEEITAGQMRTLLGNKQSELQQRMEIERFRLGQVEARLKQIELEGQPSAYDPLIKHVPEVPAVSIREHIASAAVLPQRVEQMHNELTAWAAKNSIKTAGYWLVVNHDREYTEANIELEVIVPLAKMPTRLSTSLQRIRLSELEDVEEMASLLHTGGRDTLTQAYAELAGWVQANGYWPCGPSRELVLDQNDLFEVQMPVEKALRRLHRNKINNSEKETDMEPKFETRAAFMVVGMLYQGKNENQEIKAMWGEFIPRFKEIEDKDLSETYGVCATIEGAEDGEFEYVAGVKVNSVNTLPEDMVVRFIPAQKYAIFTVRGALDSIPEMYSYIYQSWLPQSGYELADRFDFEMYDEKFKDFAEGSELYLFIPIKEK